MMQLNVVVLFAITVVPGQAVKDNPVSKVVELIKDLKEKIEADGETEQKLYDKFACWCEKTLGEKAAAIDLAKETIEKTQTNIIALKAKLAELGVTLQQLEAEIATNEEARKESKQIREKEKDEYVEERTEAEQCIGALESAIKVLSGAGTKKAMLETLQQAQLLSVAADVKGVLKRVPPSEALTMDKLNLIKEFVDNPSKFVSSGFSGAQVHMQLNEQRGPFGDYAPASGQIQGILKGMYDSFTGNLEKANAEEAGKAKNFKELYATQLAEHETLTATLEMKTKEQADSEKQLADDKVMLKEVKEQLKADEKFFAETKVNCKNNAVAWADRSRLRTEELMGINKAIEILEGGEETFEAAHEKKEEKLLLLQISSTKEDKVRTKAYNKLRALVVKNHGGLRLAFLAAELQSGGHFDNIITMIDRMINDLRIEEQEDIKAKELCEEQMVTLKNQKEDLEYDIEKKGEAKKRAEANKEEVEENIEKVKKEIEENKESQDEARENRISDGEEFNKSLKDDMNAVALLQQAIESLTAFYTNNKLPLNLAQVHDDPPPQAFGGSYGGSKGESTGIISILTMLKEDLEKEIAAAKQEEEAAQMEYQKQFGDMRKLQKAQEGTETTLNGENAELDSNIADTEGEISNHEDMHDNTKDEIKALKKSCSWVKEHFESRMEKRKAEIEGLQEAKAILAGAPADTFLQLKK